MKNAIEFVNKFGSKSAKYWIDHFNNVNTLPDEFINTEFLGDLKSLVEAHDLVESYGSLDNAKNRCYPAKFIELESYNKLKQAIADVESCL